MRKHGYFGTPTHISWMEMRRRCYDPRRREYANYGGRGIRVCARWNDPVKGFERFLADMGPRPSVGHTIGRRKNAGNYSPKNCRWETVAEQNDNKSTTVYLTYAGKTLSVTVWAHLTGVPRGRLYLRHRRGWSDEEVLRDVYNPKPVPTDIAGKKKK